MVIPLWSVGIFLDTYRSEAADPDSQRLLCIQTPDQPPKQPHMNATNFVVIAKILLLTLRVPSVALEQ